MTPLKSTGTSVSSLILNERFTIRLTCLAKYSGVARLANALHSGEAVQIGVDTGATVAAHVYLTVNAGVARLVAVWLFVSGRTRASNRVSRHLTHTCIEGKSGHLSRPRSGLPYPVLTAVFALIRLQETDV